MSSLKLLIVIDGLWVGGTERSLAEMLPFLKEQSIAPVIFCLRHCEEGVEREVIDAGFDVRFISGSGYISRIQNLRKAIQSERPDLIHTSLFQSNIIGRFAAAALPVPVLTSLVNTPYEPVRFQDPKVEATSLRLVQMVDGWTSRHLTDHFHAVSNQVKAKAIQRLRISPDRITVIERGRDTRRLGELTADRKNESRRNLGLSNNHFVLINVGRHEYQKGQTILLEAMSAMIQDHPELILLIAGRNGSATDSLTQLCKERSLASHVRFLGHRDDIGDLLAAADAFVFPSLFEGLPGAVLEAMALHLPILASDIPPLHEVTEVNQNSLLFQPGNTAELIAIIRKLLTDPDLKSRMGKRSYEIFSERFTLEKSVSRMTELYQRLVSNTKESGR